eukprot:GFYU01014980.1.p1 GENE.GFYU01014980.1~~GFYU01014980.1.p1  ORF type:complete len:186 (-),score=45.62 GFYU01014980.1:225-782(-)
MTSLENLPSFSSLDARMPAQRTLGTKMPSYSTKSQSTTLPEIPARKRTPPTSSSLPEKSMQRPGHPRRSRSNPSADDLAQSHMDISHLDKARPPSAEKPQREFTYHDPERNGPKGVSPIRVTLDLRWKALEKSYPKLTCMEDDERVHYMLKKVHHLATKDPSKFQECINQRRIAYFKFVEEYNFE